MKHIRVYTVFTLVLAPHPLSHYFICCTLNIWLLFFPLSIGVAGLESTLHSYKVILFHFGEVASADIYATHLSIVSHPKGAPVRFRLQNVTGKH